MSDFPVLTRYPTSIQEMLAYDPTIRSEYENGVVKSRPRFTSTKKKWLLSYRHLTSVDKAALISLQNTYLVGSNSYTWTNPDDDVEYTVRLAVSMVFSTEPSDNNTYQTKLEMVEA